MRRAPLLAGLTIAAILPVNGRTDGCYMPPESEWRKQRERSLILEPDQKALIFFDRGREQLIISPNYAGQSSDFAWVVPVPARPKVEILKGAPFHELARLVEPPPMRKSTMAMGGRFAPPAASVTVIERKTVGDYDVSVLSATDSRALMNWLAENHYHLPPKAEAPMKAYVRDGWTFVASKIRLNDHASGLKTGTLTPLKLTFDTQHPMYPMRLTAASAQPFTLLLYIAEPNRPGLGPLEPMSQPLPRKDSLDGAYATQILTPAMRASFPTLAKLSPAGLHVTWLRRNMRPEQCVRDYVWQHRGEPIVR